MKDEDAMSISNGIDTLDEGCLCLATMTYYSFPCVETTYNILYMDSDTICGPRPRRHLDLFTLLQRTLTKRMHTNHKDTNFSVLQLDSDTIEEKGKAVMYPYFLKVVHGSGTLRPSTL